MKIWQNRALALLDKSLSPVPVEMNEMDWKSGLSDKSERIARHISAFANYPGGGFMAFGIDNNGKSAPLPKDEMDEVIKKLGNIARNNLAQLTGIDHAVMEYAGSPVLFICIPEHPEKPVHLKNGDVLDSYKRSAGQTVKLTRQEVKQLIAQSTGLTFEAQVAHKNLSDDEALQLLDYDSYFSLQEKRLPETKKGILEALAGDDLIVKSLDGWDILSLGALLFARNLSQFKELKRKAVRVIVYKETSRINALKEQEGSKGYAFGFEGLVKYIMDQLPTNEVIEKAIRKKAKYL